MSIFSSSWRLKAQHFQSCSYLSQFRSKIVQPLRLFCAKFYGTVIPRFWRPRFWRFLQIDDFFYLVSSWAHTSILAISKLAISNFAWPKISPKWRDYCNCTISNNLFQEYCKDIYYSDHVSKVGYKFYIS
jgi:hypothetical protein